MKINEFDPSVLYDRYSVHLVTTSKLCGGIPRDPDLLEAFVKAKTGHDDAKTVEQVAALAATAPEVTVEQSWIGFQQDSAGLFITARNIKAMLRECASVLRIFTTKTGSKQIVQHGFEVVAPGCVAGALEAERIRLCRDNDTVLASLTAPDGYEERAIHVMTAQGPRNALKRSDYVNAGTDLLFDIWVLKTSANEKRHIGRDDLVQILTLAQNNGLGADRSQGFGKFNVKSLKSL
jgi:hypothetical protein